MIRGMDCVLQKETKKLALFSLAKERPRENVISVYKYIRGISTGEGEELNLRTMLAQEQIKRAMNKLRLEFSRYLNHWSDEVLEQSSNRRNDGHKA